MPTTIMPTTPALSPADTPSRDVRGLRSFTRATRLVSVGLVAVSVALAFAPRDRADRAEAAPIAATASPTPAPAPTAIEITDVISLVAAINEARTAKGMAMLQSDPILDAGAQQWADAMATQGSVSHDPQLTDAYSDDWSRMSENVATGASIGELHADSLRSGSATVLDPNATRIGVGVALLGTTVYLVERTVS